MTKPRFSIGNVKALLRESSPGYSLVELIAFGALVATMAAFVLPFTRTALNAMNLSTDARSLASAVSLAKMRAAADFSKARLRADLASNTFYVERFRKATSTWVAEGQIVSLAPTVGFGFSTLQNPPPNTQAVLGQAPTCLDGAGVAINGSACIVFNSRGIPVDAMNASTGSGALYLSDGSTIFGVTVSTGGHVQLWRAQRTDGNWSIH